MIFMRCCVKESWNVQWPAHDLHDMIFRLIEHRTNSSAIVDAWHSIEANFCTALSWFSLGGGLCGNVMKRVKRYAF